MCPSIYSGEEAKFRYFWREKNGANRRCTWISRVLLSACGGQRKRGGNGATRGPAAAVGRPAQVWPGSSQAFACRPLAHCGLFPYGCVGPILPECGLLALLLTWRIPWFVLSLHIWRLCTYFHHISAKQLGTPKLVELVR